MHLSEFKAWFEGFTEGMDYLPNEKQWKRIQAKIADISTDWTPRTVYIDRYVRPWYDRPHYGPIWSSLCESGHSSRSSGQSYQGNRAGAIQTSADSAELTTAYDWQTLGRADYLSEQA